jgi:hypothetical protein
LGPATAGIRNVVGLVGLAVTGVDLILAGGRTIGTSTGGGWWPGPEGGEADTINVVMRTTTGTTTRRIGELLLPGHRPGGVYAARRPARSRRTRSPFGRLVLGGGGDVDSGDGEPIGNLLVEGNGDLLDRGDGPGDGYRHVVNGGAH